MNQILGYLFGFGCLAFVIVWGGDALTYFNMPSLVVVVGAVVSVVAWPPAADNAVVPKHQTIRFSWCHGSTVRSGPPISIPGGIQMIVLAGTITFDPERSEEMLEAVVTVVEATRAEEGCLEYVIAPDPLIAGQLNLFERWESDDHLGAHQKADHSRPFQRALADCGMTEVSIDRYDEASVTKLL